MNRIKILKSFIMVFAVLITFVLAQAKDEHIWLHVNGRYIKTSAYAQAPEQIFMPAGSAWRDIETAPDIIISWYKSIGCNTIRLSFNALPNPLSSGTWPRDKFKDIHEYILGYLAPIVESCRRNQVYVYLDQHEYMQQYSGTRWDSWKQQPWTKEQAQMWIDYWVEIANYFKDEPWVLGYELSNEPCYIDEGLCRKNYLNCLKAIRQIDKRHIILLGSNEWSQARSAEVVWSSVGFKPDEPYNQVVFSFHEYPRFFNIYKPTDENPLVEPVDAILTRLQDTYNVPMFCTEFGSADPEGQTLSEEEKRQFEKDLVQSAYNHKIGWSLWCLGGWSQPDKTVAVFKSGRYEDIWMPAAKEQGSPIPKPGIYELKAAKLVTTVYPYRLYADGESLAAVTASVCDMYGNTIESAVNKVIFEIKGKSGVLITNEATAVNGRAAVKVKSTKKKGKIIITARADGLAQDTLTMDVLKPLKKRE